MDLEVLKFPIGHWKSKLVYRESEVRDWIQDIAQLPEQLDELLKDLQDEQLIFKYRPDGWTIRQVIHHIPDSHMNGYIRHKLTITQVEPTINPYLESVWATLEDVQTVPVTASLQLLKNLHLRWSVFLKSLDPEEYTRIYIHPEHQRSISIQESIGMYSWHGRHHLAHIKNALENPY
ncbi:MAG: putative metal-dependent hydrolase [Saprospiraceae bacterium]